MANELIKSITKLTPKHLQDLQFTSDFCLFFFLIAT